MVSAVSVETRWVEVYADLAHEIVSESDLPALLQSLTERCVEAGLASGAGIVIADAHGVLRDVAYSNETVRGLEQLQIRELEGPCVQCFQQGRQVEVPDLVGQEAQWPRFTSAALRSGIHAARAVPLRLRDHVLGALNLFDTSVGSCAPGLMRTAQGLADLATLSILSHITGPGDEELELRVAAALASRSMIERAKGFLAEVGDISMDEAYRSLRDYSRGEGIGLTEVARRIVFRAVEPDIVLSSARG